MTTEAEAFDAGPQQRLLEHVMGSAELPETAYHYTTSRGFLGILADSSIWGTDIRFLNDAKEYQYTLDLMEPVLRERASKAAYPESALIERWLRALDIAPNMRLYAVCFSEDGDLLSQWRAYARSGFALGFDPDHLMAAALDYEEPATWLRCIYDRIEQKTLIDHALNQLRDEFLAKVESQELAKVLNAFEVHFFGHLIVLASSFKHPSFREEREWRLTIRPRKPEKGTAGRSVRDGRRGIVPFRILPLAAPDGTLEIRKVIVGPTPHIDLARDAARIALEEHKVRFTALIASEIPYRDW